MTGVSLTLTTWLHLRRIGTPGPENETWEGFTSRARDDHSHVVGVHTLHKVYTLAVPSEQVRTQQKSLSLLSSTPLRETAALNMPPGCCMPTVSGGLHSVVIIKLHSYRRCSRGRGYDLQRTKEMGDLHRYSLYAQVSCLRPSPC